ncbi:MULTISPECIES: LysR family transcriptional regulator [unclassified Variovorax]|uniref:LysR family transcriptional regulator n=1 Tax=unclassified Variovorax TaxID=663243 RepID=UPI0008D122A8|nr:MULTISPECIES: LysR family transcriptional regulator [unclassified Variovorax]SEJ48919.1 transcriptional regulator, LysR family [Variovorax sp. OK202]SFC50367.1 transcriptional regulator, LysR family [Variovorax sp. OK212]
MDRIQSLRLFTRVVDLGSFSRAAAELGIGQPSATKQVARMEGELGARLLHRSTHGVTPTEVGNLYYEKCKLIVHHDEEARSVATLMQSQVQGVLRISASIAFGRRVLAPMVLEFLRTHPRLLIDLSFEDRYVNLVEQGVDVAIRMGRLADSTLGATYLGVSPWVAVASPAYLQRHGVPAKPDDLPAHHALVYSTAQGDAIWHFTGSGKNSTAVPVNGRLRSNNLTVLLSAARDGFGVAVLPHYVASDGLRSGEIVPILSAWTLPAQEVHAVYPSPRMVPAKVQELVGWLKGRFTENWWHKDVGDLLAGDEAPLPGNHVLGVREVTPAGVPDPGELDGKRVRGRLR